MRVVFLFTEGFLPSLKPLIYHPKTCRENSHSQHFNASMQRMKCLFLKKVVKNDEKVSDCKSTIFNLNDT